MKIIEIKRYLNGVPIAKSELLSVNLTTPELENAMQNAERRAVLASNIAKSAPKSVAMTQVKEGTLQYFENVENDTNQ